ncbi:hypothetical protein FPV67DRAFT_1391300, partial [Lyophyllum atratum]
LGDDDAEGREAEAIDEFDGIFGNGADLMDIDLPDDAAIPDRENRLLQTFSEKLAELNFETCDVCFEEGFTLKLQDGICHRCREDKADPVRKWSTENKVNPAVHVPACLKGLTDIEDMLIARVKSFMQVRWTKG